MENIGQATGAAMNALPIDKMIAAPILAAISAQVQASHQYVDFIKKVGLDENGQAVMIDFSYDEDIIDEAGHVTDTRNITMKVPLLAIVSHPNVSIDEITVDFEMTVTCSEETVSETAGEGGFDAKIGWGPFSVKVHGKVSHKSAQTRKTDTSAKYSIHTKASRQGPPEGMMKVLDAVVEASTRPARIAASSGGSDS